MKLTGARFVDFTNNVGHASFVTQERCQVNRFLGIIARERLHATTMATSTLLGVETHGAMTGRAKFPVRL